jgi:hypothetical protein
MEKPTTNKLRVMFMFANCNCEIPVPTAPQTAVTFSFSKQLVGHDHKGGNWVRKFNPFQEK